METVAQAKAAGAAMDAEKVERVEVKDVRVPERLQKAMAAEAEAAREARAKVGPCHHYLENDDICIYISPCLR